MSYNLITALPTRVFAFLEGGSDILLQRLTGVTGHVVGELRLEVLQTLEGFFRPGQLKETFGEPEVSLQMTPVQRDSSDAVTQGGVHVTIPVTHTMTFKSCESLAYFCKNLNAHILKIAFPL